MDSSTEENNWHILMHTLGVSFSQALVTISALVVRGLLLHPGMEFSYSVSHYI